MLQVRTPATDLELDQVRALMRGFTAWHRARHQQDRHLIDQYFDPAAFEEELASLPGKYAPPRGALLLATVAGEPAGCVAMRELDAHACEMKRMFVYPHMQGRGVGRALGEAVVAAGRAAGFRVMRLDTSIRQDEARALYRRMGFRDIEPYYELPPELRDWLVFMELALAPEDANAAFVRAYYDALAGGADTLDWSRWFAPDVVQEEFPNRLLPAGVTRDLAGLREAARRGQSLMASQAFTLLHVMASGDRVVVEAEWSGIVGRDAGPLTAGTELRTRFAQVLELRDGRIARLRNYDCFYPW
jgi:ketosteroid isomerase-like protein/GNAT superfamily N-acetyltransferase